MRSIAAAKSGALGVAVAVLAAASTADAQERPSSPFNRMILVARAEQLAKQEYVPPPSPPPDSANRLSYDQYKAIRFQKGASIWAHQNRTFTLDLFHPGFIFDMPVNINLVIGGMGWRVLFKRDLFEYPPEAGAVPEPDEDETGYSGFRVRAPINKPGTLDEFLVFQGATYFRAVGRDQLYGASGRGLAIRTARPDGEEFPVFTDFWIERPAEHATEIVIHALLQSASVVGAYTFTVKPGAETDMDVVATLFPRRPITNFGIAPLNSMFLFDPSVRGRFDDFRAAVHDSDGLEIVTGRGERVWRPLANPRSLQVSAFLDHDPRGFGLVQRKRRFEDYQDPEAHFEHRPSVWVEPQGNWGEGHVELVEIPSDREIHDNIVAYWQSATPLPPGQASEFSYRLRWLVEPLDNSLARVVGTRSGVSPTNAEQREFVVDFRGAAPPPPDLEISVTSLSGKILSPRGMFVPDTGVYRVTFDLAPEREPIVELRLVLTSQNQPWAETWLYRWSRS
jgi:glucans biosynthesis protein